MTDYKDEIITKVAWHYYIENLTQLLQKNWVFHE